MKYLRLIIFVICLAAVGNSSLASSLTPLFNAFLQTPLNGNGQSITNVAGFKWSGSTGVGYGLIDQNGDGNLTMQPIQGSGGSFTGNANQFGLDGSGANVIKSGATLTNLQAIGTGIISTSTNFTGSLTGDVTGTQGATVAATVGGVTAANVASGATAANNATTVSTPNTIVKRDGAGQMNAIGGLTSSQSTPFYFTQALGLGNDAVLQFINYNSESSMAGASYGYSGTNALSPGGVKYGGSGIPLRVLSVNADGSTNYLYDQFGSAFGMVPANSPHTDYPGYSIWVCDPGVDAAIVHWNGSENQAVFVTDYLHHLWFSPQEQNNGTTIMPGDPGFQFGLMYDTHSMDLDIQHNVLFGNNLYIGTNTSTATVLATPLGINGGAMNPTVDISVQNANVIATNFAARPGTSGTKGFTFPNGSGMAEGSSGNALMLDSSAALMATWVLGIRFEQTTSKIRWTSSPASTDAAIGRLAAGMLQVEDGSGNSRDLTLRTANGQTVNAGAAIATNSLTALYATASTVPVFDASKNLISSSTLSTDADGDYFFAGKNFNFGGSGTVVNYAGGATISFDNSVTFQFDPANMPAINGANFFGIPPSAITGLDTNVYVRTNDTRGMTNSGPIKFTGNLIVGANATAATFTGDISATTNLLSGGFSFTNAVATSATTNYTINFGVTSVYNFIYTKQNVCFQNFSGGPGVVSYTSFGTNGLLWPTNVALVGNTNGLTLKGTNWFYQGTNRAVISFEACTNLAGNLNLSNIVCAFAGN